MTWYFAYDKCYCSQECRAIFDTPGRLSLFWKRAFASFWRTHGPARKKKRVHNKAFDAVDAA
jgi:hypothetical protein